MNRAMHRFRYLTGLQTFAKVVEKACTLLGTLDIREGFNFVCDHIASGDLQHFAVDTMEVDEETGKAVPARKTFVHCGLRPDGVRLITDGEMLDQRAAMEGDGLPPMLKASLDHDASIEFRFNPEIMELASLPGVKIGQQNDDFALAMREHKKGIGNFRQPTRLEDRRPRSHVDGGGISYQGSDGCRGVIEFATAFGVGAAEFEFMLHCLGEEYDLTIEKARKIRAAGKDFLIDPVKYGVTSKPVCTLAAAIAITDVANGDPTNYILQQDASQSGFQGSGMAYGCPTLCTLTNLCGGDKRDFYTAVTGGVMLGNDLDEHRDMLLARSMAKFMVMRIGYGASTNALIKGLLIHNAQKSKLVLKDYYGCLSDGARRAFENNPQILNKDYGELWRSIGWDTALTVAEYISRQYEQSIYALSPRLREGVQQMRKAANYLLDNGSTVSFTAPCGWDYTLFQPVPDMEAKSIRLRKKVNGVEVNVKMKPLVNGATASMLAPDFMHTAWDASVRHGGNVRAALKGHPTADIHDSMGRSPAHAIEAKEDWRAEYIEVGKQLPAIFHGVLAQAGMTDANLTGGKEWDYSQILESKYFIS